MNPNKNDALRITEHLRQDFARVYGKRLTGVYLYGSYARDEATDDSDIDIAIVLSGELHRAEESRRTGDLLSDICLRENTLISVLFLSEDEWINRPFAIHRNISREGIMV